MAEKIHLYRDIRQSRIPHLASRRPRFDFPKAHSDCLADQIWKAQFPFRLTNHVAVLWPPPSPFDPSHREHAARCLIRAPGDRIAAPSIAHAFRDRSIAELPGEYPLCRHPARTAETIFS